MKGMTLDAGPLIAFDRNDRHVVALIARAVHHGVRMAVPAGVVGQVWRDGKKQARIARLLASAAVDVVALDDASARGAGQLCGARGTSDVIDASVVLCARSRGHAAVMTTDATNIARLDPHLRIIAV